MSAVIESLRQSLHPGAYVADARLAAFAAAGSVPRCVVTPVSVPDLQRALAAIGDAQLSVVPTGAGARMHIGNPPRRYDVALCTRDLNRVVAHEAADLTVTVEAGCTLTTVNGILARAGQWIPIDPALPDRTTIGGLIACDACGPLRYSQGKLRDLLIGITVVLADGRSVRGGGRVVKNVAGYDLMKLFTGSWGSLAVIAEATFKVRPRPPQTAVFMLPAGDIAAAADIALQLGEARLTPLYVEVINAAAGAALALPVQGPAVIVGFGGSVAEIEVQSRRLIDGAAAGAVQEIDKADAARVYTALRDWPLVSAARETCGATISVLPSRLGELLEQLQSSAGGESPLQIVAHAGSASVCVRNRVEAAQAAAQLNRWQAAARQAGGCAVLDLIPEPARAAVDPWGAKPPSFELMRGIKASLDPNAIISPGRFVGGL